MPLAAAVLLHAAVIAGFIVPSFGVKPADASLKPFSIALLAEQSKMIAPAKLETGESLSPSRPAPSSRQAASAAVASFTPSEPVPARAVEAGAASATASAAVSAGLAAGQPRTGASIPAHYAAGNKKPDYPLLARRLEEQGTVVLRVLVREDGTAGKVVVRQSSGHELLDQSARTAVEKWRFQPASIGNVAVAEWYQVAIPFTLYN